MKFFRLLVLCGAGVAGCGGPQLNSGSETVELFEGAVTVRILGASDNGKDLQLEIVANEPGWIRIGYGPNGVSTSTAIGDLPDRYQLRLVSEVVEGKMVVERYVSPFFGKETTQQLQVSSPGINEKKLVYSTLYFDSQDSQQKSEAGPFITPLPMPHGSSIFSLTLNDRSSSIDGPVRIAGWLHNAWPGDESSSVSWSIGADMVRVALNGVPVEIDGISTIFRELTIEYSTEPLYGPPEHACAIANRRCPESP